VLAAVVSWATRARRVVIKNLAEGVGVVLLVSILFRRSLRAAIAVVIGVPDADELANEGATDASPAATQTTP
jgi:hypothetical protein